MSECTSVPMYHGQTFHPNPSQQIQHQQEYRHLSESYEQINQNFQQCKPSQQRFHSQQYPYHPYQQVQNYHSQASFTSPGNLSYHSQPSFQPSHQSFQEFHPLIEDNVDKKHPEPFVQEIPQHKEPKRRRFDYLSMFLLLLIWVFLTMACVVLLFFAYSAAQKTSEGGISVTGLEIFSTIMFSTPFLLLSTVLNEVLVERAWRRVICAALGNDAETYSNEQMSRQLRAANFEWLNIVKRLWTHELSSQDFKSSASYIFLRWGTAISIASIQLCVSWEKTDALDQKGVNLYTVNRRGTWIVVPVILHSISTFGALAIWLLPPWSLFSSRYNEYGLFERYQPYLQRMPGGSIVKYEVIARNLNPGKHKPYDMSKTHTPGIQFFAKLKGIWFGLLLMTLAPAAAGIYTWCTQSHGEGGMIRSGIYRFGFHLVFLAQNIFYILALDFAVWNVTLEGFCLHGPRPETPNQSLRHLGYSSGIMLFIRACKQRRPLCAMLFLWLFWFQALLVRSWTVLYAFAVVVFRYQSQEDRKSFWDPAFWLGYCVVSMALTLPLFVLWLFTPFQAPVGEQDGWRWAMIAKTALYQDGWYGVEDLVGGDGRVAVGADGRALKRAAWGKNVASFRSVARETLY